jgi:hypothetical protein
VNVAALQISIGNRLRRVRFRPESCYLKRQLQTQGIDFGSGQRLGRARSRQATTQSSTRPKRLLQASYGDLIVTAIDRIAL